MHPTQIHQQPVMEFLHLPEPPLQRRPLLVGLPADLHGNLGSLLQRLLRLAPHLALQLGPCPLRVCLAIHRSLRRTMS